MKEPALIIIDILAADCIDSYDREHHEISLRYMSGKIASVLSNENIRRALTPSP